MKERDDKDKLLRGVDPARRSFLKRLLGTSFAVPVVASFSIEALTSETAQAQTVGNQTFEQWYLDNIFFFS